MTLLFSSLTYACGDNSNAMVQGPFKDQSTSDSYICFQNSNDKKDIYFYQSFDYDGDKYNQLIDAFYYSDAPVELLTVFFARTGGKRNVVVLLRWNVNYVNGDAKYKYYYEIKAYEQQAEKKYTLNSDADKDFNLSGYQTLKNNVVSNF